MLPSFAYTRPTTLAEAVKALARRVLSVLGPRLRCRRCAGEVLAVHILRTRGLDELHGVPAQIDPIREVHPGEDRLPRRDQLLQPRRRGEGLKFRCLRRDSIWPRRNRPIPSPIMSGDRLQVHMGLGANLWDR